jgi:hypothetical protein
MHGRYVLRNALNMYFLNNISDGPDRTWFWVRRSAALDISFLFMSQVVLPECPQAVLVAGKLDLTTSVCEAPLSAEHLVLLCHYCCYEGNAT